MTGQAGPSWIEELLAPRWHADALRGVTVAPGWWPLLASLAVELDTLECDWQVAQVKEKFGVLCVHLHYDHHAPACAGALGDPSVSAWHVCPSQALVADYEARSRHVCEVCGAPGTLAERGRIRTVCPDHADDR